MISLFMIAAALLAGPEYAPNEDAGVSFFQDTSLRHGERIRFRAEAGAGWDQMPIHVGSADKGMFGFRLYDEHLSPGGSLTVETTLMRRGSPVAHVTMKIPVEPDRRYLVHTGVQSKDPTYGCMGCIGTRSARIPHDRSRRLWVYYSFNGISGPILF